MKQSTMTFAEGYRAAVVNGSLLIKNPVGIRYAVNPAAGTCSCPATKTCKHLRNWKSLCFDQAVHHLEILDSINFVTQRRGTTMEECNRFNRHYAKKSALVTFIARTQKAIAESTLTAQPVQEELVHTHCGQPTRSTQYRQNRYCIVCGAGAPL